MSKRNIRQLLGNTARVRVIDFLVRSRGSACSVTEIARRSRVSRGRLHEIMPALVGLNLVKFEGERAQAKLYRFNERSPIGKALVRLWGQSEH